MSHPSWVRGLKHLFGGITEDETKSHPSWVRGLKHHSLLYKFKLVCRTLRGCVD